MISGCRGYAWLEPPPGDTPSEKIESEVHGRFLSELFTRFSHPAPGSMYRHSEEWSDEESGVVRLYSRFSRLINRLRLLALLQNDTYR